MLWHMNSCQGVKIWVFGGASIYIYILLINCYYDVHAYKNTGLGLGTESNFCEVQGKLIVDERIELRGGYEKSLTPVRNSKQIHTNMLNTIKTKTTWTARHMIRLMSKIPMAHSVACANPPSEDLVKQFSSNICDSFLALLCLQPRETLLIWHLVGLWWNLCLLVFVLIFSWTDHICQEHAVAAVRFALHLLNVWHRDVDFVYSSCTFEGL